jgi:transposase
LAHPPATRVLAKHRAKTDRCDADRLGEFYLQGILPESYLAPPEVRSHRDRIRYRMALSCVRTGIKNRIQAVLHRQGVLHDYSDLFGKAGREFLDGVALPEAARFVIRGHLEMLEKVQQLLDEVEQWMRDELPRDETVRLLMTLPGIGLILAHVLASEIGQIERFPSSRHLASYAGLAPVSNDSADRRGPRHLSAACNHTLRWALLEAANVIARCGAKRAPRLWRLYQRLSHRGRTNKNQAKVAVARELIKLVHVVWSKRQPYTTTPSPRPGMNNALDKKQDRKRAPQSDKEGAQHCRRSDQPRHAMVRRASTDAGQTLL